MRVGGQGQTDPETQGKTSEQRTRITLQLIGRIPLSFVGVYGWCVGVWVCVWRCRYFSVSFSLFFYIFIKSETQKRCATRIESKKGSLFVWLIA